MVRRNLTVGAVDNNGEMPNKPEQEVVPVISEPPVQAPQVVEETTPKIITQADSQFNITDIVEGGKENLLILTPRRLSIIE